VDKEELKKLKDEKTPFVIRIKKPDHDIINHDVIQGEIITAPDEVDSFVILHEDGTPSHDFTCACDDMLSGVDFIIRSEKHPSNTPKQIHIKKQLGYDEETAYAHLPLILNAEGRREDTLSVKWLFEQGFIPDAIANYLILLGNDTPEEIFTIPEALEWFDLNNILKSPVNFDIDKLRYINRKHLEKIDDERLSMVFGFADEEIGRLANSTWKNPAHSMNSKQRSKRSSLPKTSAESGENRCA